MDDSARLEPAWFAVCAGWNVEGKESASSRVGGDVKKTDKDVAKCLRRTLLVGRFGKE
jgi:hypothetical protein